MIVYGTYTFVFNDVDFGIAVRVARLTRSLTQTQLAVAVGWSDGNSISRVECATQTPGFPMEKFIALCNMLDLRPSDYFDVQKA